MCLRFRFVIGQSDQWITFTYWHRLLPFSSLFQPNFHCHIRSSFPFDESHFVTCNFSFRTRTKCKTTMKSYDVNYSVWMCKCDLNMPFGIVQIGGCFLTRAWFIRLRSSWWGLNTNFTPKTMKIIVLTWTKASVLKTTKLKFVFWGWKQATQFVYFVEYYFMPQ